MAAVGLGGDARIEGKRTIPSPTELGDIVLAAQSFQHDASEVD
jgi:hypothetical protein